MKVQEMMKEGGKGKNKVFNPLSDFSQGDAVVLRVKVTDADGLPLSGASVEISISGPENLVLTTGQSDANGWADATWSTKKPKGGQAGTAIGIYTAVISNLSSSTHNWDGVATTIEFTIG